MTSSTTSPTIHPPGPDADFILHHYSGSPFSEKVRLMFGLKGLGWRSVTVPMVMPKPDVVALTGGYRKTPFLQVGADVYCDTALIARVLERAQPTPSLFPASCPLAPLLAAGFDTSLFWAVASYVMQPAGQAHLFAGAPPEALKAFAADRAAYAGAAPRWRPVEAQAHVVQTLDALEAELARRKAAGEDWIAGPACSVADLSLAHPLWFIRRAGPLAEVITARPRLNAWLDRTLALGHGTRRGKLDGAEALAVAAAAPGHAPAAVMPDLGFAPGQPVTVAATDTGTDPVSGELVGLDPFEVVLRRTDPRAGTVHVHFPRQGFRLSKTG